MKEVFELDVYRLAEDLSDLIWYAFDEWVPKVQHTIGYQIIRSSDSIAANIAEGYGLTHLQTEKDSTIMPGVLSKKQRPGCAS